MKVAAWTKSFAAEPRVTQTMKGGVVCAAGGVSTSQPVSLRSFQGLRASAPAARPCTISFQAGRNSLQSRSALTVVARTAEAGMGIYGTKAGMTQIFTEDGLALPATVIALEPGNIVTQVKTPETDGYSAVQLGYRVTREKLLTKPQLGHLSKHNAPPMKQLREFKIKDVSSFEPGQQLKVEELFSVGDLIDVAGTSIGKGFQGSIKRWGMKRGQMTHGSKSKRQHGSIGACATPSRVLPGLKMAGHMGAARVKARKLKILKVDAARGAIVVKGSVPGKPGNVLEIAPAKIVGKNI